MEKGSPLGGAPATPTVKQVKRAFASYIKYLNAHPDALSGCFKDEAGALDDRAHEAARVAIRELRAAWQPLKPSTSAPELHIALTEMKTDIHPKFGFQSKWKGDDAIDETEACQLWSEYLRLHRALNLSAGAEVFQQGMADGSALEHIRPIEEARADAARSSAQRERAGAYEVAAARRAEEQAARISAACAEAPDEAEPTDVRIHAANPISGDFGSIIKAWAVRSDSVAHCCFSRIAVLAKGPGWFAAVKALTETDGLIQAMADSLVAHRDHNTQLLGVTALSILTCGVGSEGSSWSESEGGMQAKQQVMEAGGLEIAAANLLQTQPDREGRPAEAALLVRQVHQTSANLIGTVCFGHDGRQGHGDPVQANERRQRAADAGVIEALCSAINFQASGGYTEVGQGALRAFQRILLGFGADQEQRRRRALQAGALPAIMSLLLARLEHSSRSDFRG